MTRIGIITDTRNCLPEKFIKRYNIKIVPAGSILDKQAFLDQLNVTSAEILGKISLQECDPAIFAPYPEQYEKEFTAVSSHCDNIICIFVSKILSGSQNAALLAKKNFLDQHPEIKIEIIDTKCTGGVIGLLVLEAARAIERDCSFEEVIELINKLSLKVSYLGVFNNMKYLIRDGPTPKMAVIENEMGIILSHNKETGAVISIGQIREKKQTLNVLVHLMDDYVSPQIPLHVLVYYTTSFQYGKKLKEMIQAKYNCEEIYLVPLKSITGPHTGPELSISFY